MTVATRSSFEITGISGFTGGWNRQQFPPPHQPILRIHHLANPFEPALRENVRRGVLLRSRMSADEPDATAAERERDQPPGNFRSVASPLVFRVYPVRNLDYTVGTRWALVS